MSLVILHQVTVVTIVCIYHTWRVGVRQQHPRPRPRPRLSGPGQVSQHQQPTYQLTIISIIIQHTMIIIIPQLTLTSIILQPQLRHLRRYPSRNHPKTLDIHSQQLTVAVVMSAENIPEIIGSVKLIIPTRLYQKI